jgi:hypothetical protein
MSPQQQQMLLSMMMNRGTAGMQFGAPGMPTGAVPGGQVQLQPSGLTTAMGNMPANPLVNQQMNPAMNQMNPMLMQYLMGMGQAGGGMQQPNLAALLSARGGNTWGLGL